MWNKHNSQTPHHWWEYKMVQPLKKPVWHFLIKVNMYLPSDPAATQSYLPRINENMCLYKDLYIIVHNSFICCTQNNPEAHQQVNGHSVACSYSQPPISSEKEWTTETCISLHESQKLYARWKRPSSKHCMRYDSTLWKLRTGASHLRWEEIRVALGGLGWGAPGKGHGPSQW